MNKIDLPLFLHSLLSTFKNVLKIDINKECDNHIEKLAVVFDNLKIDEKKYYTKYAMDVAEKLTLLSTFNFVELNNDSIKLSKNGTKNLNISFSRTSVKINNIIPNKLMKKCKYIKSTKVYKEYTELYSQINQNAYSKFNRHERFTDISESDIEKYILLPVSKLIVDTLSRKKKHAQDFYNAIFNVNSQIVIRLYKNRFTIYDFYKTQQISSFKISLDKNNRLVIIFNNNAHFICNMCINSPDIQENLSLKLHIKFVNMDQVYKVNSENN